MSYPFSKHLFIVVVVMVFISFTRSRAEDWRTYCEKSNFKKTPRYKETVAYARRLAQASPWVSYATFGKSPQGRDLPLLIVNRNGHFNPGRVRADKQIVFYIQAGIHSGEIDGKDAGLMLIRDLVIDHKYPRLLDRVTILFNPIFNVDGHERFGPYNRINQNGPEEMGWRVTAQNLNLNRDYLKADAPEMKQFLRLYNTWLPEFFADCHVTDGADYQYAISYMIDTQGLIHPNLVRWTQDKYLPPLKEAMKKSGFPLIEYVSLRKRHDVKSGIVTWTASPRFSNGFTPLYNRPGLLIETHMLKDYKTRVEATYQILKHTLAILNRNADELRREIEKADALTASAEFRKEPFALTYKQVPDSVMINFAGYAYQAVHSDLTGGIWYRYDEQKPQIFHIPYFNKMAPDIRVQLPEAYIIPAEWQTVIDRIKLHGISFRRLALPVTLTVDTYKFDRVRWQKAPYEGRQMVSFRANPIRFTRKFPAGSIVIGMNQARAKVIANILEPEAEDSFVHWGFFNAIFEQKEYVESYVIENLARKMLKKDVKLRKEFQYKMKTDSAFAANPARIRNWFYQRSLYRDQSKNVYPVGRILERNSLSTVIYKN